jgi:transposase
MCEYKELGAEYLISKTEAKRKAYLKSELTKLGYVVELKELLPIPKAGY